MTDDFDRSLSVRLSALANAVPVDQLRSLAEVPAARVKPGRTGLRLAPTGLLTIAGIVASGALIAGVLQVGPLAPVSSDAASRGSSQNDVSPQPTASADVGPQVGRDSEGPYSVEIRSGRRIYLESEPIDISAVFAYSGEKSVSVSADAFFPLAFGIREPVRGLTIFAARAVPAILRPGCRSVVLQPGDERRSKFTVTGFSPSPPNEEQQAFLASPELHLPPGTWHFVVESSVLGVDPCAGATGAPAAIRSPDATLSAEIEIDVVSADGAAIDLATGRVPTRSDGTKVCLTALGSGILALNPRTGLGFVDESGRVLTDVVWPDGYSARYKDGQAILLNDSGDLVATVGDEMSLGGGYGDDNVFHVCGAGMAGDLGAPPSSFATDGGFELRLAASSSTFREGDPIEVAWSLVNASNPGSPQVLADQPLVAFSAREVGGTRHVDADVSGGCAMFGLWSQGDPIRGFLEQSGPHSGWTDPAFVHGFGPERDVYLPVGTWVLSGATRMLDSRCESTTAELRAEITITIVP